MKFLNNRKVGTKLVLLLIVPLLSLVLLTVISIRDMNMIKNGLVKSLFDQAYVGSSELLNADRDLYQALKGYEEFLRAESKQKRESALEEYRENIPQVKERVAKAAEIFEANRADIENVRDEEMGLTVFEHIQQYEAEFDQWIAMTEDTVNEYGNAASDAEKQILLQRADTADSHFDKTRKHIDIMQDFNETYANAEIAKGEALVNGLKLVFLIIVCAVVVIVALFGWYLIARLVSAIKNVAVATERVAKGDLRLEPLNVRSKDEIGRLTAAFNTMKDNLGDLLGSISDASEQVASGARQVSDASMSLSQGSTEQASSIEQLTASIEQISEQTKHSAVSAGQASNLSASAVENAVRCNRQMKEMLTAMAEINDASANISKIIKVIDEIAFQTNILALNAAVEAARAGGHGKGFAVVAEEVRNLAARSANAAKETTAMIENSVKKAETGSQIAGTTAEALDTIVEDVRKAAALAAEISEATNEQASAIAQINLGINQVSQVTQTNSATSEQCAAASEEMASQAEMLKGMVARFELKRTEGEGFDSVRIRPVGAMTELSHPDAADRSGSSAAGLTKPRISLHDNDFGKY
ncbi:methyl-accepting chemotaxis protein [Paenibacillus tarimensis]